MTARSRDLDDARARADGLILKSLGLPYFGQAPEAPAAQPGRQLALNAVEKAVVLGGMRASGADKRFDATLGTLTGGSFSGRERDRLKDRALDAARMDEVTRLTGIREGVPVQVTPAQKATIDRIVGRLGGDELGRRAQEGYQGAVREGKIRVR